MIDRIDHLVLTVADIPATVSFYKRALEFEAVEKDGRWSLKFGQQKINLHQVGHTFDPKAARPTPGSSDLCFIAAVPLEVVQQRFAIAGIEVVEGPVSRNGALGPMKSIYFRDPDGNLVEVAQYA
ncbi:VOC family protein [Terriglobus roseus]|uniref:Catechol 2,3-dioxygenase n=1 Tax=Terriglobus roseus TaxID=392734 RepID=A0A1H4KC71_9BACT|nr:VOC family protein [Terriglobus roseus]SEB56027.1 Catechol 2,3-dioxygenase [Terriglobus roseus]